jgi:hypothetical protein
MRPVMLTILGLALTALPAAAGESKSLDAGLKEQADRILQYAREQHCKNVGVLKFLVRTGDGAPSDNVGSLNLAIADRLTVALVLACRDEEIGIIRDASAIAARIKRANHLDEDGRRQLFSRSYPLAWGEQEQQVRPDLFVTGLVTLSPDLRQTTIELQTFRKDGNLNANFGRFTAPTSARTLIETGKPFLLTAKANPDLFNGAKGIDDDQADRPSADASQKFSTGPAVETASAFEKEAPVKVTLYYDNDEVAVKNGAVPEPMKDQKVWFKLENVSKDSCGVVLKVNGVNTIFKERLPDRDCHKWILKPGGVTVVRGFQMKLTEREDFVVLSASESQANEVRYGELAGLFQVSVFVAHGPAKAEPPALVMNDDQRAVAAIAKGSLDVAAIPPGNLRSLQSKLRKRVEDAAGSRGMVDGDPDNPKPHLVEKVEFKANPPAPVMSYPIRYYSPKVSK